MLNTPWDIDLDDKDQPQHRVNQQYIYCINFKGYDNWRVVDLVITNVTEEEEKIYEIILHGAEVKMNERILTWNFVAMRTNDEALQGYYLIKWITEPYIVQDDPVMKGMEPQQTASDGEIIRDAVFWNPVPKVTYQCTPMTKQESFVMIRLKQVLITGVQMKKDRRNEYATKCIQQEMGNRPRINEDR